MKKVCTIIGVVIAVIAVWMLCKLCHKNKEEV